MGFDKLNYSTWYVEWRKTLHEVVLVNVEVVNSIQSADSLQFKCLFKVYT